VRDWRRLCRKANNDHEKINSALFRLENAGARRVPVRTWKKTFSHGIISTEANNDESLVALLMLVAMPAIACGEHTFRRTECHGNVRFQDCNSPRFVQAQGDD
jgi:hypothetical protein